MKKLALLVWALMLTAVAVTGFAASDLQAGDEAMVSFCDEYITLRESPRTSAHVIMRLPLDERLEYICQAENGFARVATYDGAEGFVLEKYLAKCEGDAGSGLEVTEKQRYNINLFLSNFTEQGFMWNAEQPYERAELTDAQMIDFAVSWCWFNESDNLVWGEYDDENNVCISDEFIAPVSKKYLGAAPRSLKALNTMNIRPAVTTGRRPAAIRATASPQWLTCLTGAKTSAK